MERGIKIHTHLLRSTQRASGTIVKDGEAQPPFDQNWLPSAPGAVTAKSLDLVVGGEVSQRAAWSRSSRTADKDACLGGVSIRVDKGSTTAFISRNRVNELLSGSFYPVLELIPEAHKEAAG